MKKEIENEKKSESAKENVNDQSNIFEHNLNRFEIFEKWLADNGTHLEKLELRDYGNEVRGCHSKEEIKNDEIIIQVPLKCLITVEMGKESEIGKKIISSNIELDAPKHIFLMIFMLVDRKSQNSFFKPYYDILPKTLNNMPIFWNSEELGYLQGSYLLEQIDERNAAIESDYLAICNVAPEFRGISTLQEFKWARMCVCSRNFGLIINGVQTAALVPYADMLNHYRPRETKWQFDDNLQGFTVISLQKIAVGAQVYDSYGRKCNHRFLLNYGFSVENNYESDGFCPNEVPILLEMTRSDPLFDSKCLYWKRDFSIPSRRLRISVSDNENIRMMLAMIRIMNLDRDDFEMLVSILGSSVYRTLRDTHEPVSVKNEIQSMQSLIRLCDEYLQRYPTTYEEDCELLNITGPNSIPMFSNRRHAMIQVRGEKEVLLFYKDFAMTSIFFLTKEPLLPDQNGNSNNNNRTMNGEHNPSPLEKKLNSIRSTKHVLIFQHCRNSLYRLAQDEIRREEIRRRNMDFSKPTIV